MNNELTEVINEITKKQAELNTELENVLKGNKAAGLRARKITLELDKLNKSFRKLSVSM